MKRTGAALAAAMWILGAAAASASEQSKIETTRGLVELNAGREEEALRRFEAAVAADGRDPMALYYRGVTRGRRGDLDGAIVDLQAALRERPDLTRASLELGAALLRADRPAEAAPQFAAARRDPELAGRATLFEGIARLRMGEDDAADALLREAGGEADQHLAATYYRGVVEYRRGRHYRARNLLEEVVAAEPGSPTAKEAQALLDEIGPPERRWELTASSGFQYDSNVLLAPTGDTVEDDLLISDEADGRAVLAASGRWVPARTDYGRLQLGYDFYQSLHFELDEFNIQSHGVGGDFAGVGGDFDWGAYGWYDFHLLEGEKFLSRLTFLPWLGWRPAPAWRTEVSARLRNDDFYGETYGVRDSSQGLYGLRQFFHLADDRFAWVGYRYDDVDSTSDAVASRRFQFGAHEAEAGVRFAVVPRAVIDAEYSYRHERYDTASEVPFDGQPGLLPRRVDDAHRGQISLRLELTKHIALLQGVAVTDSASTQDEFTYDRIIGSVVLEVGL